MPLYEVLETSYINDRLVLAGSIIDYMPPKATRKPPAGASDDEKAKPHYQDTVIGPNLRLARGASEAFERPADTIVRAE